jgi:hypothetical protein
MVEDSRRENCRGVRIGANVFVPGSSEGKMEMWRGLFWRDEVLVRRVFKEIHNNTDTILTFLPMTPRQAIEGIAVDMVITAC